MVEHSWRLLHAVVFICGLLKAASAQSIRSPAPRITIVTQPAANGGLQQVLRGDPTNWLTHLWDARRQPFANLVQGLNTTGGAGFFTVLWTVDCTDMPHAGSCSMCRDACVDRFLLQEWPNGACMSQCWRATCCSEECSTSRHSARRLRLKAREQQHT
jgi:hypothetical protein